eukprot:g29468.t1
MEGVSASGVFHCQGREGGLGFSPEVFTKEEMVYDEDAVSELISRIQVFCYPRRIRVKEFFNDFDPLRHGRCTFINFARALDTLGMQGLSDEEVDTLAEHFTEHGAHVAPPQVVNYIKFCEAIDKRRLCQAKGKAAAAPSTEVLLLDVPPPPPAAVCLPLPDSMLSRCATERCLLLSWGDSKGAYKVQVRQWIPGDPTDRASSAEDWRDAKEIERVKMPGRGFHEGRLYAFEQIRIQYRMVLLNGPQPIEGRYVTNWSSVPSEPVATFVDPPVGVRVDGEVHRDPEARFAEIVAGVVQIRDKVDQVTMPLRGLLPNQWYCIQVDARYPYVGKRAFSDRKALSPPFLTPFPSRPPLQPIPVRMELDEELEELPPEEEGEDFRWALRPWVSLRVEKGFLPEKYVLQYKEAVGGGEELGKEHFEGWQEPVVVERFSKDKRNTDQWDIVRVGLPSGAPEVVLLRLMTLSPKTAAPLQWSSASPPVVSSVAVPRLADLGAGTVMRLMPTSLGFRLFLRFFLQPGAISREGHLPLILQRAATPNESVGHRYVTQYQLRVRMKGETQKELPVGVRGPRRYIELPPSSLPTPCTAPGEVTDMGEPETTEEALVAGLLGHFGTRYELMVDLEEKLWEVLMGHELLEASMRVGTEHRWSCWTPWSGAQGLQLPLPTPLKTSSASAEALGPTAIRVSWAPFDRAPGVTSLEYVIQAEPLLGEDGTSGSSSPAETVICFQHEPRKHDGQLVVTPQFQRLLDPKEMSGLGRLVSLLPWTSYLVSVSARYPAGAGLYPRSQLEGKSGGLGLLVGPKLTTQASVETPGGPNTPTPPRQVGWNDFAHDLGEDASFQPNMRAILLSIEVAPHRNFGRHMAGAMGDAEINRCRDIHRWRPNDT